MYWRIDSFIAGFENGSKGRTHTPPLHTQPIQRRALQIQSAPKEKYTFSILWNNPPPHSPPSILHYTHTAETQGVLLPSHLPLHTHALPSHVMPHHPPSIAALLHFQIKRREVVYRLIPVRVLDITVHGDGRWRRYR